MEDKIIVGITLQIRERAMRILYGVISFELRREISKTISDSIRWEILDHMTISHRIHMENMIREKIHSYKL